MNRWTGIGRVTKDPKRLPIADQPLSCTVRIAVKRAGTGGRDGHFDVECFGDQAVACAEYARVGREIAVDGRLAFEERQTQDGSYASRVYIVAERVELLMARQ